MVYLKEWRNNMKNLNTGLKIQLVLLIILMTLSALTVYAVGAFFKFV